MQIASSTLTCKISIIGGGNQADRLGRSSVQIADIVRQVLQLISFEADFVMHNVVMGGTSCALVDAVSFRG